MINIDFLNNDICLFSKRVSKLKGALDSKEISNFLGRSDEDLSDLYTNYYNFIANKGLLDSINEALDIGDNPDNYLILVKEAIVDAFLYNKSDLYKFESTYNNYIAKKSFFYKGKTYNYYKLNRLLYEELNKDHLLEIYNLLYGDDKEIEGYISNLISFRKKKILDYGYNDYLDFISHGVSRESILEIIEDFKNKLKDKIFFLKNNKGLSQQFHISSKPLLIRDLSPELNKFRCVIESPYGILKDFYSSIGFDDDLDSVKVEFKDINANGFCFRTDPPLVVLNDKNINFLNISTLIHEFGHALEFINRVDDDIFANVDPFSGISEGIAILFSKLFYSRDNLRNYFNDHEIDLYNDFKIFNILNFELTILINTLVELEIYSEQSNLDIKEIGSLYKELYMELAGIEVSENQWLYDQTMINNPFYGLCYIIGDVLSENLVKIFKRDQSIISKDVSKLIKNVFFNFGGYKNWYKKFTEIKKLV